MDRDPLSSSLSAFSIDRNIRTASAPPSELYHEMEYYEHQ